MPNWRLKARYEAAGASDTGRRRASNEDAYGLDIEQGGPSGNFVVCDGMGGAAAGEVASRVAAAAMLLAMGSDLLTSGLMRQAVSAANASVYDRVERDPALAGMGTTLVAFAVRNWRGWIAHVGDSRCYRLREGKLELLTRDHSVVGEQVRLGQMTPAEAATSPLRSIITRAVGTEAQVEADVAELDVMPDDRYLLASDGLVREVDDEQIAAILCGAKSPEELCAELIDAANRAGGGDNITCVLVNACRSPLPD